MTDLTVICAAAALYDYSAADEDELSLAKGDVVNVLSKQDDGWWNVIKQSGPGAGVQGLIPSNYVYVKVNAKDDKKSAASANNSLPSGWESSLDPESGERYYYNQATGQVQWSTPGKSPAALETKGHHSDVHHTQHNNYMAPIHHQGYEHSHQGKSGSGRGYPDGNVKMDKSDLAEFKRLREEADTKLAALRKVLSIQENLHFLEGKAGDESDSDNNSRLQQRHQRTDRDRDKRAPIKPSADRKASQLSPRNRVAARGGSGGGAAGGRAAARDRSSKEQAGAYSYSNHSSSPNLRLDPSSLKAIARLVDTRLEQRDDVLIGKMKAIVENATSPSGSPLAATVQRKNFEHTHAQSQIPHYDGSTIGKGRQQDLSIQSLSGQSSEVPLLFTPLAKGASSHVDERQSPPNALPSIENSGGSAGKSKEKPAWALSYKPGLITQNDIIGATGTLSMDESGKRANLKVARYDTSHMPRNNGEGVTYPQCRSAVYPPTAVEDGTGISADELVDSTAPSAALALNHVYAYSGDAARHGGSIKGKNIMFLDRNRIIYPAAALVILMDIETQAQGFFSGHTEDVTCITVHPDRTICASGQIGKDGRVLIWDSSAIADGAREYNPAVELLIMGGTRGVSGLNFSGDGRFLVAVGMDENHTMTVFDWANQVLIASVKIGHGDVSQMGFNPFLFTTTSPQDELKLNSSRAVHHDQSESCCYTLVTCGGRAIKFWTLRRTLAHEDEDKLELTGYKGKKVALPKKKQTMNASYTLEGNTAVFPKTGSEVPDILCFVCVNDAEGSKGSAPKSRIFTGTSTGSIYIWQHLEDVKSKNSLTQYSWQPRGRLLSVVSDVHESPIVDIDYTGAYWYSDDSEENTNERLVTCSKDGIVNVWRMDREVGTGVPFEHMSAVNVGYADANLGAPRCISWDLDGATTVVGTTGNALMLLYGEGMYAGGSGNPEVGGTGPELQPHVFVQPLVRGHHGKILRIAAHPTEPVFATISTDKTLRLWNSQKKAQIALTRLAERATAVEFARDGSCLAIGNESGEVMIVKYNALNEARNAKTLGLHMLQVEELEAGGSKAGEKQWQVILRRHVAAKAGQTTPGAKVNGAANGNSTAQQPSVLNRKKSEITELKFSPDGDVLAVGCRDNLIHLLSVHNGYKRAAVCRGHSSYIKNIDFSADGRVIQATDAVREILFWEVSTGKQIANAAHTRDVDWASGKCALGWHVQGIFNGPAGVPIDGEMNAVCRSKNKSLLVAGGSNTVNNAVKLFRYPCVSKSIPSLHGGHTSPVLDVMFLAHDSEVVTVGGSDSTIFTWSIVYERGSSRSS